MEVEWSNTRNGYKSGHCYAYSNGEHVGYVNPTGPRTFVAYVGKYGAGERRGTFSTLAKAQEHVLKVLRGEEAREYVPLEMQTGKPPIILRDRGREIEFPNCAEVLRYICKFTARNGHVMSPGNHYFPNPDDPIDPHVVWRYGYGTGYVLSEGDYRRVYEINRRFGAWTALAQLERDREKPNYTCPKCGKGALWTLEAWGNRIRCLYCPHNEFGSIGD